MAAPAPQTLGFLRVAAAVQPVELANPATNAEWIIRAARAGDDRQVDLLVTPELSLTGKSVGVLGHTLPLLEATVSSLEAIRRASADLRPILAVGAPLVIDGVVRSCAVWVHEGSYLGVVPQEAAGAEHSAVLLGEDWVEVGDIRLQPQHLPGVLIAARVGSDVWEGFPRDAHVVAALGGDPAFADSAVRRSDLLCAQSELNRAAIVYAAPGCGESTNDLAWNGQSVVAEEGTVLAAGPLFARDAHLSVADVNAVGLVQLGLGYQSGGPDSAGSAEPVVFPDPVPSKLERKVIRYPWRVADPLQVIQLQASALVRRMVSIGEPKLILGVSGGLDSTLALLAACGAMDCLGRPREDILGYTMPGFGTSAATRESAEKLCAALGVAFEELDIRPAAREMLTALGHPVATGSTVYDVTYENVQAGLRTDYLFRLANLKNGLVVGTGDLSELALGWCTYGVGDQMSHYGVNAGLPKTVIQDVIAAAAEAPHASEELRQVLTTILHTDISPELLPATDSAPRQSTEAAIGPYELQDFTLFYVLKYGFGPSQILLLAREAWGGKYSDADILKWMEVFFTRFFSNQFKREAAPNAPRLMAAGSLSPRTDWNMPSDAQVAAWLDELEGLR